MSVAISADGQTIVSGSEDKTLKLWNRDGREPQTFKGHQESISSVAISADGQTIVSGSADRTIKLWSLNVDNLMALGCDWIRDYLSNSKQAIESDKAMCAPYLNRK